MAYYEKEYPGIFLNLFCDPKKKVSLSELSLHITKNNSKRDALFYFNILPLNPNLIMTNYISLERSKTPKYIFYHCLLLLQIM